MQRTKHFSRSNNPSSNWRGVSAKLMTMSNRPKFPKTTTHSTILPLTVIPTRSRPYLKLWTVESTKHVEKSSTFSLKRIENKPSNFLKFSISLKSGIYFTRLQFSPGTVWMRVSFTTLLWLQFFIGMRDSYCHHLMKFFHICLQILMLSGKLIRLRWLK